MLTEEQARWIAGLSQSPVVIFPFDPQTEQIFNQVRSRVGEAVGEAVVVEHRGASAMGMSGQGDVDVYVLAAGANFNEYRARLVAEFGEPDAASELRRARWNMEVDGFKVEVMLVNEEHPAWQQTVQFEQYLRDHAEAMEAYRRLKEEANGLSRQEYYRRKTEFINEILIRLGLL